MLRVARGGGGAHHCEAGLVWDVWDKEQNERQWGNQKAKPHRAPQEAARGKEKKVPENADKIWSAPCLLAHEAAGRGCTLGAKQTFKVCFSSQTRALVASQQGHRKARVCHHVCTKVGDATSAFSL